MKAMTELTKESLSEALEIANEHSLKGRQWIIVDEAADDEENKWFPSDEKA